MDVWQSSYLDNKPMDVMVPPRFQSEIKEILAAKHIPYHVMIPDVQGLIDSQMEKGVDSYADFNYNRYHTYDEVRNTIRE